MSDTEWIVTDSGVGAYWWTTGTLRWVRRRPSIILRGGGGGGSASTTTARDAGGGGTSVELVLQQAWQSSRGVTEWRDVEVVEEDLQVSL